MSIFESKSQIVWRKIRTGIGKAFRPIGAGFKKVRVAFRDMPQGSRTIIRIGGVFIVLSLVVGVFLLPILRRSAPEPEVPQETVAETITRIDLNTQGHVTPDMVPDLINIINETVARSDNDREIVQLYILRFKVYFNAGMFYNAALVGPAIRDLDFELEGRERFDVYHLLVFANDQIGDTEQRRYYASLVLREFENGTVEDTGSMQYYYMIAHGLR